MPYSHIFQAIAARIGETREFLRLCRLDGATRDAQRSARGLAYVSLFGLYENVVAESVSVAIRETNRHTLTLAELKYGIAVLALSSEFESLRMAALGKTWTRAQRLLERTNSMEVVALRDIFPADGSYMKPSQLRLIWEIFELPGAPWPEPKYEGRIVELVETRNRIAHGKEPPSDTGARITDDDLDVRIQDVEALCTYIAATFSSSLGHRTGFLR